MNCVQTDNSSEKRRYYEGKTFSDIFQSEAEIMNLLSQTYPNLKLVRIDTKNLIEPLRIALTITVRDDISGSEKSAYIDIYWYAPITEQFVNAVYGEGANFSHRIILSPSMGCNQYMINMARVAKSCGYDLCLVKAEVCDSPLHYEVLDFDSARITIDLPELPSREKVLELDFWSNCFCLMYTFQPIHTEDFKNDFHSICYELDKGVTLIVQWNDNGLLMSIVDEYQTGIIDYIWRNADGLAGDDVYDFYPDMQYKLVAHNDGSAKITFHFNNIPITEILKMTCDIKRSHGQLALESARVLARNLEELIRQ